MKPQNRVHTDVVVYSDRMGGGRYRSARVAEAIDLGAAVVDFQVWGPFASNAELWEKGCVLRVTNALVLMNKIKLDESSNIIKLGIAGEEDWAHPRTVSVMEWHQGDEAPLFNHLPPWMQSQADSPGSSQGQFANLSCDSPP